MSTAIPFVPPVTDARADARTDAHTDTRAEVRADARPARAAAAVETHSLFLPLLLLALAVVGWSGFQTFQLLREREQLAAAFAAQQPPVEAAARVRANLDALAASTQRLANAGDANARTVVDALRQRGVNINPNPAVPTSPAAVPVR